MTTYDNVYRMDTIFGIWNYSDRIRVTFVNRGWLVVWDHQQSPPTRYDCEHADHAQACEAVVKKIRELLKS